MAVENLRFGFRPWAWHPSVCVWMDPQFHICVEIKFAAVTHQSTRLTDNEFYALKRSIYKKLDRTHYVRYKHWPHQITGNTLGAKNQEGQKQNLFSKRWKIFFPAQFKQRHAIVVLFRENEWRQMSGLAFEPLYCCSWWPQQWRQIRAKLSCGAFGLGSWEHWSMIIQGQDTEHWHFVIFRHSASKIFFDPIYVLHSEGW